MNFVFHIGAPVLVEEGEAGRLKFVVVDPDEDVVTDLIVERGHLLHRSIVVPATWVTMTDPNKIVLNARIADLEALPTYREIEFQQPDPAAERMAGYEPEHVRLWMLPYGGAAAPRKPVISRLVRLGIDEDAVLIGRDTRVTTADGQAVGSIDHLLVDPRSHEVTHLVLHPRFRLGHDDDVLVTLDQVAMLGEQNVRLNIDRSKLEHAPRYQPAISDAQLEGTINRALETQPETRGRGLRVEVDRGLARIVGDVPESVARAAAGVLRRIRGVIGVDDRTKTPA